jgi:hypothetical protein
MNKKGIIAISVVLVLLAGAVWYFGMSAKDTIPPASQPSTTTPTSTLSYVNNEYGFTFSLPVSWQGYIIVTSTWTGYSAPITHGPIISIRSPLWTSSTPTQDIPVMVFTLAEWSAVSSGTMAVSAAPFPPSELGRNARYVFALPARYNYAFPQDWQEVQDIIQSNPLHAF